MFIQFNRQLAINLNFIEFVKYDVDSQNCIIQFRQCGGVKTKIETKMMTQEEFDDIVLQMQAAK